MAEAVDRRVRKTRAAIAESFDRLLLERGSDDVSMREVADTANVGRSTLYEHFEGKDDLLERSIARPLSHFAAATLCDESSDALFVSLTHLSSERTLSLSLFNGTARAIVIRVLARELEERLATLARRSTVTPEAIPLFALSLAHAQVGLVEAWLSAPDAFDLRATAHVLKATTRAVISSIRSGRA